jgi:very-short-patch-repair endonuclease
MKLTKAHQEALDSYDTLSDTKKKSLITNLYHKLGLSLGQIAKEANTYTNRIRRDAIRLDITIKDRSQAQKDALATGVHPHPTKGKQHTEKTKEKLSATMVKVASSSEGHKQRVASGKKRWNDMSLMERQRFVKAGGEGIRQAAKEGSKLEKYLRDILTKEGYHVDFHRQHFIASRKMHLDLYLPSLSTVIEVDGPMHSEPIFGYKALQQSMDADRTKTSILLANNFVVIRVKQKGPLSTSYKSEVAHKVVDLLHKMRTVRYPSKEDRFIEIGG